MPSLPKQQQARGPIRSRADKAQRQPHGKCAFRPDLCFLAVVVIAALISLLSIQKFHTTVSSQNNNNQLPSWSSPHEQKNRLEMEHNNLRIYDGKDELQNVRDKKDRSNDDQRQQPDNPQQESEEDDPEEENYQQQQQAEDERETAKDEHQHKDDHEDSSVTFHFIVSSECSSYQLWETLAQIHSAESVRQCGKFTWILSGCLPNDQLDAGKGKSGAHSDLLTPQVVQEQVDAHFPTPSSSDWNKCSRLQPELHFTPDFSDMSVYGGPYADGKTKRYFYNKKKDKKVKSDMGNRYVFNNKPRGLLHWAQEHAQHDTPEELAATKDEAIVLIDPDFLFLSRFHLNRPDLSVVGKPYNPQWRDKDMVFPGQPAGASYGLVRSITTIITLGCIWSLSLPWERRIVLFGITCLRVCMFSFLVLTSPTPSVITYMYRELNGWILILPPFAAKTVIVSMPRTTMSTSIIRRDPPTFCIVMTS
mgnify:CR=1 FL=1